MTKKRHRKNFPARPVADVNSRRIDLSVIVVSWNARSYLLECLESLRSQNDGLDKEIIVVDNGSSDGSPEGVSQEFPEVMLIQSEHNLGFAKANNIGIGQSKGKYVCLVNSDVVLLDGCLAALRDFMENNPEVGLCGPRLLNGNTTVQHSCRRFPTVWRLFCDAFRLHRVFAHSSLFAGEEMTDFSYDSKNEIEALSGAFLIVRKKAIAEVGLLDESFFMYSEDVDWCRRFYEAGWKVSFFPGSQAIHFGGGSSAAESSRFSVEKQRSVLIYFRKHHGRISCTLIRVIFLLHHLIRMFGAGILYVVKPSRRSAVLVLLNRATAGLHFAVKGRP